MPDIRKRVDQTTVDRWAELSGDLNPLHVDPAFAATTRYGGTILHGHLTVAWIMEWALAHWGPEWIAAGELDALRFLQPLRPGVEYVVTAADVAGAHDTAAVTVLLPDGTPGITTTARLRGASND